MTYRTHNCGALRRRNVGDEVILSGWVYRKRDHGGILFIDLRDFYGVTQIVVLSDGAHYEQLVNVRLESVVSVKGKVRERTEDTVNSAIETGGVEVAVAELDVLSEADPLPFSIATDGNYPEDLRFRYRFLDLRRDKVRSNIVLRASVISSLRQKMRALGFLEIQTPILTASSPEGARDYLVPSRLHLGKFYALPQAPQQFKQLAMIGGLDKYFQIAPCFRDEDPRADRAIGDFYQLDIEMSFVTQEELFSIVEKVIYEVFAEHTKKSVVCEFPRITYAQSMLKYGSDKPDLRNPIVISDVSDVFARSDFSVFRDNVARGMVVRAIPAPRATCRARSFFDQKVDFARSQGLGGLGYISFDKGVVKGPIAKFLSEQQLQEIRVATGVGDGDSVFFASDTPEKASAVAGAVRTLLGRELDLINDDEFKFCWVIDFPMFCRDVKTGKLDFMHNPFSMPQGGFAALDAVDPTSILAYQYDLVCNGIELSSGAVRNHKVELMRKVFALLGYSSEHLEKSFPALMNGLRYGAPPHAGIAPGIDRIVMMLAGEQNVREVVCFPLNQRGEDLLMGAPSEITEAQLRELGLSIRKKSKVI